VRIFQIFDANDTAYIVLEFVEGADLEAWLRGLGRRPTQEELDRLTGPLLEALALVHAESILHRDVKPQNIYIRKSTGAPVLLDFGAARYATGDLTGTTAAIVSRGYSPHEAYARESKLQGPWSDIYGLAATLYRALHGEAPPESAERVLQDTLVPVARLPLKGYRKDLLNGIDWGLSLRPQERPQTVAEWRARLVPGAQATGTTVPSPSEPAGATPAQTGATGRRTTAPPSAPRSADAARPTGQTETGTDAPPSAPRQAAATARTAGDAKVASEASTPRPAQEPSRLPLVAILGGLLMLGGGGTLAAIYFLNPGSHDSANAIQRRELEDQQRRDAALRAADEQRREAQRKEEERQAAARSDDQRREAARKEEERQATLRADEQRREAQQRKEEERQAALRADQQRREAQRKEEERQAALRADEQRREAQRKEEERLAALKEADERRELERQREQRNVRKENPRPRQNQPRPKAIEPSGSQPKINAPAMGF
jgi:serine/threonine protein kinase